MKIISIVTTASILSLAALTGCSKGPSKEEQAKLEALQAEVDAKDAQAKAAAKRADELAEAKRLAEEAAKSAREAEAARLAELAAQFEREKQEKTRLAGLVDDLNAKSQTASAEQQRLQDALAKARMDREQAAIEADKRIKAAQAELAASEARKQAEIKAAREAALSEALAKMESRAQQGGYTAPTEVSKREKESISAFLAVEIAERNFRNNTRRTEQRREAE